MAGQPKRIHHKKTKNLLELTWGDGKVHRLSGDRLRQFCACANCRAKGVVGMPLLMDNSNIRSLALMGSTGLQITFGDGHDRGVYPWEYLQAIADNKVWQYLQASK